MLPTKHLLRKFPHTFHDVAKAGKLGIVGAPFTMGQPNDGVDLGPDALRNQNLLKNLNSIGYQTTDYGDLKFEKFQSDPADQNVKNPLTNGSANDIIHQAVKKSALNNDKTVVLGGDHAIAVGSVFGHAMAEKAKNGQEICCLWVDAHADINTSESSPSGNLHGQPVSQLVKSVRLQSFVRKLRGFEWCHPVLPASRLAYIGLRDLDHGEVKLLEHLGIPYSSMSEVDAIGISACVEKCLDRINPSGTVSTHVSFDIDALDPIHAPATGTPVDAGLSLREGLYIGEEMHRQGINVSVMDLVEVNPLLGNEKEGNLTAKSGVQIISAFMGGYRGGQYPSGYELPKPK